MKQRRVVGWALWALLAIGCAEDASEGGDAADAAADGATGLGDASADAAGGAGGMGGAGGGDAALADAAPVDAARDAAPPDAAPLPDGAPPTPVESCEDACARYAACDRLEELFGSEEACLTRCARVTRDGQRPGFWWDCLGVESCNLVHLCRPPQPEPLACDAICARAEGCGVELPDCEAACAESGEPFRLCGEAVAEACDAAALVECLGTNVYTSCDRACDEAVRCDAVPAEGCLLGCVGALADADPLFRLRASQRNACIARANQDCGQIAACIDPAEPGEPPLVTPDQYCARWAGCGFDDFIPCAAVLERFGRDAAFLTCGLEQMERGCPRDPGPLLEGCENGGVDPRFESCNRLCEARGVCGLLEGGPVARAECVQNCTGGQNADPDELERASASLVCGGVDRCDAFVACLAETGPAVECRDHCARLAVCGLADADCQAACDRDWARDRQAATRACVAEAADCAAIAACAPPPAAPCAAYCARAVECGLEAAPGCEARCDDRHFAAPSPELLYDACVVSAPVCRAENRNDPAAANCRTRPDDGAACLAFCRFAADCGGGADLGACLRECGRGLVGDDGLRFLSGRDCLRRQPADAACGALDACIPDGVDADCPAFCAGAAACGVELTECEGACAEDPLSRLRVLQRAECLGDAGEDCGAVRACLVPAVAPPDPDAVRPVDDATFCAAYDRCRYEEFFGPCENALREFAADPGVRRCMYDLLAGQCPANIEEVFICLEGGQPAPSPIAAECAALCEAQAFCGDRAAADQVACRRACEAQIPANDPDAVARIAPRMACAQSWSCADLSVCLANSSPRAVCAEHCGRLAGCGAVADRAVCEAACDRDFARLRQFPFRDCVRRAAACEDVRACAPAAPIPCADACAALEGCGPVAPACAAECDDQHFREPLETALQVACILGAEACEGEGGIAACFEDPGPGARACLGYCRAITECDPAAEQSLVDCLNGCVAGYDDRNGLRFAAAEDCLRAVAPDAACDALRACLPDALSVDCDAHCAELDACRVPAEGCAAACAGGDVSLDEGGCVADARRAGGGCAAVAVCVGHAPPPASAACVRACELRGTCDREVDEYLCRLDCTPAPAALPVHVACAELFDCGRDRDACFDLPADRDRACVAACEGAAACAGLFADADACAAMCTGQVASELPLPGWADAIGACLRGAIDGDRCDEDAARQCFEVGVRLGLNQGYGHHGSCETFNACNDARTCADAACRFHGHGPALSWEEGLCMDLNMSVPGGMDCNLFAQLPNNLDDQWQGFCNIPVAYDIVCRP